MAGVADRARERRARAARSGWTPIRVLRTVGWGLARMSSIIVLAVAWEWFARSGAVTPFMLPRLSLVLERIWSDLSPATS